MRRISEGRASALALLTMTTIAVAGCGSSADRSAGQPHAVTAPAAAPPQTFTSGRYGFRVTLTKDWTGDDARVDWKGRKLQGLGSPAFANLTDAAARRTLVVAAAPVANGTALATWRAAMVRAAPADCADSPSAEQTTLGGGPALAWTAHCADGFRVHKLATIHRTRGYMMLLASPAAQSDADDRRVFESIRRSLRFVR
jgi:hypothetical protein